jgi:hypothetical protein
MFIIKEGTPADKVGEGTDQATLESITKFLEKQGHVIRTTDQDKTYLQTQTQTEINKVLGERNAQFEATILETTGITKTQGEKFHEYHKRALTEKLGEVTVLKAKIKDFEEKGLQGSDLAKQFKTELENAQKQISTLNQEWEKKLQDKDTEVFSTKINTEVEKELAKIRANIDPSIKPELVEDVIASRLSRFNHENKPASLDGMTVWKGPDGITRTGKKDGKPSALPELLPNYFMDIMKKPAGGGAGSGEGGSGGEGGGAQPKWKEIQLPAEINSQVKLTDYLMKTVKLDASTKDYSEAFENLKGNLPIR